MRQFKQSMEQGLFLPVYLFHGDEPFLIDQALRLLEQKAVGGEDWNLERFDGESVRVADVVNAAATIPFFGNRRLVEVRNIPWLVKKKTEDDAEAAEDDIAPLLNYLAAPNASTILAFTLLGTAEKRRKLVKAVEKAGRLVDCSAYRGEELLLWLREEASQRGYTVERRALEYLTLAAGNNMAYLQNELDKLCAYCGPRREISLADAELLASRGSNLSIFELMDALAAKDAQKSILLFRKMTKEGEAPQKILAMFGKQFRDMLGVKELAAQGMRPREVAGQLGIHPFVAEKYSRSCRAFRTSSLLQALELLLNADIANKSGEGELGNLLETVILRICGAL